METKSPSSKNTPEAFSEDADGPRPASAKPKRTRRRSTAKTSRSSAKKKNLAGDKLAACLALFLSTLALTSLMLLWVGAAVQDGPAPLTLELGPAEPCLSAATNADIKTEEIEGLRRDAYFIPVYTFLFLSLGLVMFCATGPEWRWSAAVLFLAILTAQCDLFENNFLDLCLDGNSSAAHLAFLWSRWKWVTLALTTAATAPLFFARTDGTRQIGFVLAATGLIGLLVFIPTGREELLVHYLLSPALALSIMLIAASFIADLVVPEQRTAHWKGR
jgi:hypothetical protein